MLTGFFAAASRDHQEELSSLPHQFWSSHVGVLVKFSICCQGPGRNQLTCRRLPCVFLASSPKFPCCFDGLWR